MAPVLSDSPHMASPPRPAPASQARSVTESQSPKRAPPRVWRLALLWHGTVLDVVSVKKRATLTLRTGEKLRAKTIEGALFVDIGGETVPIEGGVMVELAAGHALVATEDIPEAHAGRLSGLDSTLFHATMIGAAVQACVVSALVLAPSPNFDSEAGAGVPGEYRRLLIAPGGTAPNKGAPSLSAIGRPPEEGEKQELIAQAGKRPPRTAGPGRQMTLEEALDEMRRVLRIGNEGEIELREAIGEMAMSTAAAPELGAGVGGLSPKDPVKDGAGNGLIGVGESRLTELIRRRVRENEKLPEKQRLTGREERPIAPIPVEMVDIPEAHVTLAATHALDPEVKEHLMMLVRERHNGIKHCYETNALVQDKTRAGRLTLELTLRPDGRVENPVVDVDNPQLRLVGECVAKMASEWYLSDRLVEEPTRLSFPFILQPRKDVKVYSFDR